MRGTKQRKGKTRRGVSGRMGESDRIRMLFDVTRNDVVQRCAFFGGGIARGSHRTGTPEEGTIEDGEPTLAHEHARPTQKKRKSKRKGWSMTSDKLDRRKKEKRQRGCRERRGWDVGK